MSVGGFGINLFLRMEIRGVIRSVGYWMGCWIRSCANFVRWMEMLAIFICGRAVLFCLATLQGNRRPGKARGW